jgi:hypothetical protein
VARLGAVLRYRLPLWTRTTVTAIHGSPRVEAIELAHVGTGDRRRVACDTVVFTGEWIADHELAVALGLELDAGTRGPLVDTGLRTEHPGVLAAGNVLHGADPADVAALSGRHAGAAAAAWLNGGTWPQRLLPIRCRPPLDWVSPSAVSEVRGDPPRGRFLLRSRAFLRRPQIEVRQGERVLWSGRLRRLGPGRSAAIPGGWPQAADAGGGPVELNLAGH